MKNSAQMGAFPSPKNVTQLRPILDTFSKMRPILVSFSTFVFDFGLDPGSFFGYAFGLENRFFLN